MTQTDDLGSAEAAASTMSNQFETNSGNHCAIIYGALPPNTKKTQSIAFNERLGDIKFLLATDAIGLGMNLSIKRIIFDSLDKKIKGKLNVPLTQSNVK